MRNSLKLKDILFAAVATFTGASTGCDVPNTDVQKCATQVRATLLVAGNATKIEDGYDIFDNDQRDIYFSGQGNLPIAKALEAGCPASCQVSLKERIAPFVDLKIICAPTQRTPTHGPQF